jgi:hypothetical protein
MAESVLKAMVASSPQLTLNLLHCKHFRICNDHLSFEAAHDF